MRLLLTISLAIWMAAAQAESIRLLVQNSPLAGSQYYAVGKQWLAMKVGDRLDLVREPDNRHDRNAIRIEWRGHKLGYVPRAENRALAAAMEQGDRLMARIAQLSEHPDPWRRLRFEVYAEL
jgi:HIRAN domain